MDFRLPSRLLKDKRISEILEHPLFNSMRDYEHHGNIDCRTHVLKVAEKSYRFGKNRRCDMVSMMRGALLHDFYLYDWHKGCPPFHGFRHPFRALENAQEHFSISLVEKDIILKHMFPLTVLPPLFCESRMVSNADKMATWDDYRRVFAGHSAGCIKP